MMKLCDKLVTFEQVKFEAHSETQMAIFICNTEHGIDISMISLQQMSFQIKLGVQAHKKKCLNYLQNCDKV